MRKKKLVNSATGGAFVYFGHIYNAILIPLELSEQSSKSVKGPCSRI